MRSKLNTFNSNDIFVLGHGYEVDASDDYSETTKRSKYFQDTLLENERRAALGLVPLSLTPHKHIVDEGRKHSSAKEFLQFKRNKLMKQGEK